MKIVLVRHAAAIERGGDVPDERRYLTPDGRISFRRTARTMAKRGVAPGLILTSPLLRSVQTADILAETLEYSGPLEAVEELAPGFDLQRLERLLGRYPHAGELVLVGHEPDLSDLAAALLGLPNDFKLRKGSAVRLNVDPANLKGAAVFKWLAAGGKLLKSREEALG